MQILVELCASIGHSCIQIFTLKGFVSSLFMTYFLLSRTVGKNSPTLVILKDTCVFTQERSLSAVGIATRLSLTPLPVKPTRKHTGESLILSRDD